jgi:hypothetical protein
MIKIVDIVISYKGDIACFYITYSKPSPTQALENIKTPQR